MRYRALDLAFICHSSFVDDAGKPLGDLAMIKPEVKRKIKDHVKGNVGYVLFMIFE